MMQQAKQIVLDHDELVACLKSYRRVERGFLPFGRIIGYRPGEYLSISVLVEIISGNTVQVTEYDFKCADLAQPLIHYCQENNIPLPSRGRASVGLLSGRAALFVTPEPEPANRSIH